MTKNYDDAQWDGHRWIRDGEVVNATRWQRIPLAWRLAIAVPIIVGVGWLAVYVQGAW